MKVKTTTELKDFDGNALMLDLSSKDLVDTLNAVIDAATVENADLGKRLGTIAQEMIAAKKKPMTLKGVLYLLSSNPLPKASAGDRETVFEVAVASMGRDEIDLKPEQIVALKAGIDGLIAVPLVAKQAKLLLEGVDPFASPTA